MNITVTDTILTGNLFNENGYDELASAQNLRELVRDAWLADLTEQFPDAEIAISIRVQNATGYNRGISVESDSDEVNADRLAGELADIAGRIYTAQWDDWAVEEE